MILGIMQPYFFPYLGYFDLIHCSDKWIIFDTVQYIRHGWINRNRILHPKEGWQYIIVPIKKAGRETIIKDIKINNQMNWKGKILGQLQHYKKKARYYHETIQIVKECLDVEETSISKLNAFILNKVCKYIGINFQYNFFSEMNLGIGNVEGPGDWALRISESLGASEYINPPRGTEIFDILKFEQLGIKLTFRDVPPFKYDCRKCQFEQSLSIIDVLMWNTPKQIKVYLDEQKSSLSRTSNKE